MPEHKRYKALRNLGIIWTMHEEHTAANGRRLLLRCWIIVLAENLPLKFLSDRAKSASVGASGT